MKYSFFVLILLSQVAGAQEIALVDRNLKEPIAVTDKLTKDQLAGKRFPIYKDDLDQVIAFAETLVWNFDKGSKHENDMQLMQVGNSQFSIIAQTGSAHTAHDIFLNTRSGDLGATLELVNKKDSNKKAMQKLQVFLDYLKNNRHMMHAEK